MILIFIAGRYYNMVQEQEMFLISAPVGNKKWRSLPLRAVFTLFFTQLTLIQRSCYEFLYSAGPDDAVAGGVCGGNRGGADGVGAGAVELRGEHEPRRSGKRYGHA